MANRHATFLLKRSNVPGKVPPASGVTLGEILLNTADAVLYTSGTTANQILPIGWDRVYRTGDTLNGDFTVYGDIEISGSSLPSGYALSVTGDTNIQGDVYVSGDLNYNGNLLVTGGTIIQSGLTANTIYTDYIDFNTNYTGGTLPVGRLQWDDGNGTLVLGLKGGQSNMELGLENMALCYNDELTTLTAGTIVYVSGSQGNRPAIKRALAISDGYSVTTLGMVSESIASGTEGFVTTFGMVNNLNTIGLTGGTALWLSPTIAGAFTSVKPQAPYHTVLIGYAVRIHASVGSIFMHISNGWEIDELHDVRLNGRTPGDLLMLSGYSGSNVWVNTKTLNGSYTITGNTTIGGNLIVTGGTQSLFSGNGSSDLVRITQTGSGNAFVVEDTTNPDSSSFVIDGSGSVGIGVNIPSAKLQVGELVADSNYINRGLILQGGYSTSNIRQQNLMTFGAIGLYEPNPLDDTALGYDRNWHIGILSDFNYFSQNRFSIINTGVEKLTILQSNGNVGIGTSTPSDKLTVNGTTLLGGVLNSTSGNLIIDHPGVNSWKFGVFTANTSTLSIGNDYGGVFANKVINITNDGLVGIGTTSPAVKLDVQIPTGTGNQVVGRFFAGTNTNGSAGGIALGSTQTTGGYIYGEQTASSSGDLVFGVQNLGSYAERMRILSSGNIGIGTTSPAVKLDVQIPTGTGNQVVGRFFAGTDTNGNAGGIALGTSQTTGGYIYGEQTAVSSGDLVFGVQNLGSYAERMRILSSGNIGIGTTSPTEKLHVSGNTIVSGTISGSTITITSTPTNNDSPTLILTRNSTTGQVEGTSPQSSGLFNYGIANAIMTGNFLT